jgi:hypothetical protein
VVPEAGDCHHCSNEGDEAGVAEFAEVGHTPSQCMRVTGLF